LSIPEKDSPRLPVINLATTCSSFNARAVLQNLMLGHKSYSILLAFLATTQILIVFFTSLYLEPLVGDETRLGGFAENDFGWNQPQKVFPGVAAPLIKTYDQYSDVLVIGDSFSFAGNFGVLNYPWQTFLADNTGFSIATLSHYTNTMPPTYDPDLLPTVVNSEKFQQSPPRVLIMEVVERQLGILPNIPGDCRVHHNVDASFQLKQKLNLLTSEEITRNKKFPPFKEQMAYAKKYLAQLFPLTRDDNTVIYTKDLTSDRLFSNRRSDQLLAFENDIRKKSWDEAKIAGIQCTLINMQNLVQKNGKTLFVALIVPDKLSAYSRYLKDQSLANLSVIERLASNPSLHLARIDLAINAAVDKGVVDVYLPNDTHWSYRGHQIAAEALTRYFENGSVVRAKP